MRLRLLLCISMMFITATLYAVSTDSTSKSFVPMLPTIDGLGIKKIALVIGNQDYQHTRVLINPKNDAMDMTASLQRLGYSVSTLYDLGEVALRDSIQQFKNRVDENTIVLIYYSGHGVGYNGQNYILPVDFNANCMEQIATHGIAINGLLTDLIAMKARTSILFLDACRNIPKLQVCTSTHKDINSTQGFTKVADYPAGSIVVYATREGNVADDNPKERNGMFTGVLLKFLEQPNWTLNQILYRTITEVDRLSGGKQVPGKYDELRGDFYFIRNGNQTANFSEYDIKMALATAELAIEQKRYDDAYNILFPQKEHPSLFLAHHKQLLGFIYDVHKKNYNQAYKWYQIAASEGDRQAQYNIGIFHEKGIGATPIDYLKAHEWYVAAAQQDLPEAAHNLGYLYEKGLGVVKDSLTALKWYVKAAQRGDMLAKLHLGHLYQQGWGVSQDSTNLIAFNSYLNIINTIGNTVENDTTLKKIYAEALFRCGLLTTNPTERYTFYQRSVNNGHILAKVNLAFEYEQKRDFNQASVLYIDAAEKDNNMVAQYNLAVLFDTGKIASESTYKDALKWYERAEQQGLSDATYNMAILYETGKDISKDIIKAIQLYRKASNKGFQLAKKALSRFQ